MLKNFNVKELKRRIPELKEKFNQIKSEFDRDALIYCIALLIIVIYGSLKFVFPNVSKVSSNTSELMLQKQTTKEMQEQLAMLNKQKDYLKKAEIPVKIYEAPYKDTDVETAGTELVNSILYIIRANGVNDIETIEFETKDLLDNAGLKSPNHAVLSIKLQLNSSYDNIQNLLNELYLMDYLVKIQNVSLDVKPESEFQRVTAYLVLDLYIKTS